MRKNRTIPFKSKPTYAFIVDGECEFWYFQMMKRNEHSLRINLKPELPQKKKLSEQFEQVKEAAKDYKMVFWVIDFDVITKETLETKKGKKPAIQEFNEYCAKLKRYKNVQVIVNNPCFEFWLLLHFESTDKYFTNCDYVTKQLKKYLPDYEKTKEYFTKQDNDIYLKLKPRLNEAIKNAKKLGVFDLNKWQSALAEMFIFFEEKTIKELIKKNNIQS